MGLKYLSDVWELMTEEQIWGNFDSELYMCEDQQLAERLIELGGKKRLKDYVHTVTAFDYAKYDVVDLDNVEDRKYAKYYIDYLNKMLKRKKIHPKQKKVAKMVKDELQANINKCETRKSG